MRYFQWLRGGRAGRSHTMVVGTLLVLAMSAANSWAATYSFTYHGSGAIFGGSATDAAFGAGDFTVLDNANPAGIGDLIAFTFDLAVTHPADGAAAEGTDLFHYGLADLSAFSASFAGGRVTALNLSTDQQQARLNWSEIFMVGSLDAGAAFTSDGDADIISSGGILVTRSDVPEPRGLAVLAAGLLALCCLRHPARWLNG
jgi:hypothetical protein